MHENQKI